MRVRISNVSLSADAQENQTAPSLPITTWMVDGECPGEQYPRPNHLRGNLQGRPLARRLSATAIREILLKPVAGPGPSLPTTSACQVCNFKIMVPVPVQLSHRVLRYLITNISTGIPNWRKRGTSAYIAGSIAPASRQMDQNFLGVAFVLFVHSALMGAIAFLLAV